MKKGYLFLLAIIAIVFLFFVSCSYIQKEPVMNTDVLSQETSAESESSSTTEIGNTESNETVESTAGAAGIDLKKLKDSENKFAVIDAFPDLTFTHPLEFQDAGDGSGRIFIVEQDGRIFLIDFQDKNKTELFLNITDRVNSSSNEKGLLGLAFHPDFKENGKFYVNYTTRNSTVVSRFTISNDNPNIADPGSEEIIITFEQPYANHNGGKLAFSTGDGFLYIAAGDGGGAGDPQNNAQNLETLLGKILRIDVDNKEDELNYSIPLNNPFKGNKEGYREEIYAYGLRNPWRFSFDTLTGELWAADVGQGKIEEIDIIQSGENYGWNIMEGSYCYKPPSGCNPEGLMFPIYEYDHSLGKSITGGYVYRGKTLSLLQGVYIYADFISGYIWGLANTEGQGVHNFILAKTDLNISSIGIDKNQELYFTAFDGKIYKLHLP